MSKVNLPLLLTTLSIMTLPGGSIFTGNLEDYKYIISSEAIYIDSCVTTSGAIIMGRSMRFTFQGTPHYKICPYFSNLAAEALLEDPTPTNLAVVKKWMTWVFNHLNSDGSIYDYYVDSLSGGAELPSIDAYPGEDIPDFDSQDSYAATFLTLARKYVEVVPSDTTWLKRYSNQLSLIGNALYATIDDSTHYFHQFSPDNNDGLSVAKLDYQAKYTMDNSEVNEGLKNMVWLEQNIISEGNPFFYQRLLDNNDNGFKNLWDPRVQAYYPYEGSSSPNWDRFYPDATCQLFPIWAGVISPFSSRALDLYNTFNSHYPEWPTGKYHGDLGAVTCYVAAIMRDTSRVDEYLSYVQRLLDKGKNPPGWFNAAAAWTLRAAKRIMKAN